MTVAHAACGPDTIRLVVLGPNALARACMVAGLADAGGLRAEACSDPADDPGPAPDLLLLQDDPPGSSRLADRLRDLGACWPEARIVVLFNGSGADVARCRMSGVRGCLPSWAGPDELVAAVRLVRAGMTVYPAEPFAAGVAD